LFDEADEIDRHHDGVVRQPRGTIAKSPQFQL
jgi:hypothetical protein